MNRETISCEDNLCSCALSLKRKAMTFPSSRRVKILTQLVTAAVRKNNSGLLLAEPRQLFVPSGCLCVQADYEMAKDFQLER